MVTVAPTALELGVSRVNLTVLAVATQVMGATAFPVSMALMFAVSAVANAVTGSYLMAFFAAPVAVSFDGSKAAFFD